MPNYPPEKRRIYAIARHREMMQKAKDLLGGVCLKCGSTGLLHFHHKDSADKKFTISGGYDRKDFWEEVSKCVLLCWPCHKEEHAPDHGTKGRYNHHKCRCDLCREANREASNQYRWRTGKRKRRNSPVV